MVQTVQATNRPWYE